MAFISLQRGPISESWKAEEELMRKYAIDEKLIKVAAIPFNRFMEPTEILFWQDFTWLRGYQAKLKIMDWENADCNSKTEALVSLLIGRDFPSVSVAGDYLFAKFIALERLQEYLIGRLYSPENNEPYRFKRRGKPLKWTGDKSNLVEVAYGLYETGQLNEGHATISEIIEWLEETLDINLSRYYRRFTEIKMRKVISPTNYLEEMRDAVLRRIEDGVEWK